MIVAPRFLKRRTVAARDCETDIFEIEHPAESRLTFRIAQTDAPWASVWRMISDQPDLAKICIDMGKAFFPKHVGNAIGDKSLPDRIERYTHTPAAERNALW